MRTTRRWMVAVAAVLLVAGAGSHAAMDGKGIVARSGLNGGLILLSRLSGPDLPMALAGDERFVVVGQTADDALARTVRDRGAAAGVLARRLYVVTGDPATVPVAEASASVVFVGDLAGDDLTAANRAAWLRALSPRRGVAIFGSASDRAVSAAKLREWLAGQPGLEVTTGTDGVWASCRRAPASGADEWPVRFHDEANLRMSADVNFKPPFLPAWCALPMHLGYWGDTMVSAGGRAYLAWANRLPMVSVSLIAFDMHNGVKLWERPFAWNPPRDKNAGGYYPGRSCLFAAPDALYMVDEHSVLRLDGETGRETSRIAGPRPDGQIKWIGVEGHRLVMLAGDPDRFTTGVLQQRCANPVGCVLAVCDWTTGEELWRTTETGAIDEREIAVRDGRLFYHAAGVRVACRDLVTGQLRWENAAPDVLRLFAYKTDDLGSLLTSARCLAATPAAISFINLIDNLARSEQIVRLKLFPRRGV